MILLATAVNANALKTSYRQIRHVIKVTMMMTVLTNLVLLSDTCDQYLYVLLLINYALTRKPILPTLRSLRQLIAKPLNLLIRQ